MYFLKDKFCLFMPCLKKLQPVTYESLTQIIDIVFINLRLTLNIKLDLT